MEINNGIIKRHLLKVLIIALLCSATIGMFIILGVDFSRAISNCLVTCLTIAVYCVSGLCSNAIYNKLKVFSLIGSWISALGLLITLIVIWEIIDFDYIWKPMGILTILSATIAQISLLLLIHPKKILPTYLLISTKVFLVLVGLMLIKTTFTGYEESQLYFWILGGFLICYLLGVILILDGDN